MNVLLGRTICMRNSTIAAEKDEVIDLSNRRFDGKQSSAKISNFVAMNQVRKAK